MIPTLTIRRANTPSLVTCPKPQRTPEQSQKTTVEPFWKIDFFFCLTVRCSMHEAPKFRIGRKLLEGILRAFLENHRKTSGL